MTSRSLVFYVHTAIVKDGQAVKSLGSALRTNKHEDAHTCCYRTQILHMHACMRYNRESFSREVLLTYCMLVLQVREKQGNRKITQIIDVNASLNFVSQK